MCLDSPVYDLIVGNYSSDVINQGVELPCRESIPKPNEHVQTTDSCENETYRSTYDDIISDQLESNNEVSPASVDTMVSGTTQISVGCTVETRGAEKRNKDTFKPLPVPEQIDVNTSAIDFKAAQKSDPSLLKLFELATRDKENVPDRSLISWYEVHDGLLFRYFQSSKTENVTRQLVVPRKQRKKVLLIGHETLLSGHQGVKKTLDRIMLNFFWPGIYSDVKIFCASCDICQRTVHKCSVSTVHKGSVRHAPLQKPQIISTPFEKVAIDIVGPLSPATDRGNRYILTLVDFSTRYPEAIALRSIDTAIVAEALLSIFSRVGFPSQVLCDNGSTFTSHMMKEVARLLSTKFIHTSLYHPMSNGLCEKWNGTLKRMLRRMSSERPKDWDRYLEPLMFAYREAPQESTQFSPFVWSHC